MSPLKKVIITLVVLAITAVIGYVVYSLMLANKPYIPPAGEGPATTTGAGLPTSSTGGGQIIQPTGEEVLPAGEEPATTTGAESGPISAVSETARGGLTKISSLNQMSSLSPTLSKNGTDIQYYNREEGKFYRLDKNGNIAPLSNKVFHAVESVVWSPTKDKAILEYPDGANIVYDFSADKQITLPQHWEDFNFSPDGEKIVSKSIGLDPDNRWLTITNDDGSNIIPLEPIGENSENVYPYWSPNNQIAGMYTEGIDFNRQEVYFIGLNGENFKSTTVEGRDFRPRWAPEGDKLVYSVYSSDNDLKPMLWVVDAEGDKIGSNRKTLGLETWADKCAFSGSYELYCGVPEKLEKGAGLFPEMAASTKDQLYKIDIRTGSRRLVAIPDGDYNMSSLMVSADGRYLYFTDATDNYLHKINLK